jgi:glutathione S-transferase
MATGNEAIVVYDNPSKDGKTWSHHVLRILFSIHYKKLPYEMEGIEYPDVISTFAETELRPKDDPLEPYEIPVIKFHAPDGSTQYRMENMPIIEALEELQPEAPLLYSSARSAEYRRISNPALAPLLQATVGHVPSVLSKRSADAFLEKRKSRWGKSVEQWVEEHPATEALAKAEPRLKELGDWLEQTGGPFVHGENPSYADFTLVSILGFVRSAGQLELFKAAMAVHPAIAKLYEAVKVTQQGNDRCRELFADY